MDYEYSNRVVEQHEDSDRGEVIVMSGSKPTTPLKSSLPASHHSSPIINGRMNDSSFNPMVEPMDLDKPAVVKKVRVKVKHENETIVNPFPRSETEREIVNKPIGGSWLPPVLQNLGTTSVSTLMGAVIKAEQKR